MLEPEHAICNGAISIFIVNFNCHEYDSCHHASNSMIGTDYCYRGETYRFLMKNLVIPFVKVKFCVCML